jgi:hypothetical protein
VLRVNATRGQVTRAEVRAVLDAGWSEEAVYDANTVCSLFQFFNSWVDAAGVADMPEAAYRESGRRMAANGYGGGEE